MSFYRRQPNPVSSERVKGKAVKVGDKIRIKRGVHSDDPEMGLPDYYFGETAEVLEIHPHGIHPIKVVSPKTGGTLPLHADEVEEIS